MGSYKWTLRRITPDCVGEWHQDGRVLGDVRVANVWIALARCGGDTDAPGLEVVPQRLDGYLVSGTDGAVLDFSIGQSRLEARVAEGEEFPLVLTVFMVMGAWRLSKARVLTRRASAIESLGAATVLCTDKTGTLTENRLALEAVLTPTGPVSDPTARRGLIVDALRAEFGGEVALVENPVVFICPLHRIDDVVKQRSRPPRQKNQIITGHVAFDVLIWP